MDVTLLFILQLLSFAGNVLIIVGLVVLVKNWIKKIVKEAIAEANSPSFDAKEIKRRKIVG